MKLQLFIACCILQSIGGGSVNNSVILPPFNPSDAVLYLVGGDEAKEGLAPFQCSLQSYGEHFCGCAVIHSKYVVTASHCLLNLSAEEINVMVGSNDLKCGGRFYEAERLILHEHFDTPRRANDIALIKVRGSIEFGENVKPIELEDEEVPDGTEVGVTGWGRLQADGDSPQKLQYLRLFAIPMDICRNTKEISSFVHEGHICTRGSPGRGTCEYDSGGPLFRNNKLVGVVNFGVPCGVGKPDVFAKVSYFIDWINKHMET